MSLVVVELLDALKAAGVPDDAIDAALAGAERGVRRSLQRRRMKPVKKLSDRARVSTT